MWSRFSAWSKTTDGGDSKTSSVASVASLPNFLKISSPIFVSRLWNYGRQWRNFDVGFPVAAMGAAFTW